MVASYALKLFLAASAHGDDTNVIRKITIIGKLLVLGIAVKCVCLGKKLALAFDMGLLGSN